MAISQLSKYWEVFLRSESQFLAKIVRSEWVIVMKMFVKAEIQCITNL